MPLARWASVKCGGRCDDLLDDALGGRLGATGGAHVDRDRGQAGLDCAHYAPLAVAHFDGAVGCLERGDGLQPSATRLVGQRVRLVDRTLVECLQNHPFDLLDVLAHRGFRMLRIA